MAEKLNINIQEALKNQNAMQSFEEADKKAKKPKRNSVQVSIYLQKDEIEYLDNVCKRDFIARNAYMRKLLVKEMELSSILQKKGINYYEFQEKFLKDIMEK